MDKVPEPRCDECGKPLSWLPTKPGELAHEACIDLVLEDPKS